MADLHSAAADGNAELVRRLLDEGADVNGLAGANCPTPNFDVSPLMVAAEAGHAQVVSLLLERGADANAQDVGGWTPLMKAAAWEHAEVVRVLLAYGADAKLENNAGNNALSWAEGSGARDIADMLRVAAEIAP